MKHRLLSALLAVAAVVVLAHPHPACAQSTPITVIGQNFPDPFVLNDGIDTYYAYATEGSVGNLQCAKSKDLKSWTLLSEAPPPATPAATLPILPSWAGFGQTWAPVVHKFGSTYVLYFAAAVAATMNKQPDPVLHAIGVATSTSPTGPFNIVADFDPVPMVYDQGIGDIDPAVFVDDDGTPYLLWKIDGNAVGQQTHIRIQQLASTGLGLVGSPTTLISNDQPWEGAVVEAPAMLKHDGVYYLFYSANDYSGSNYATGYAKSVSLTGPFIKPLAAAWFASTTNSVPATVADGICGPGGLDTFVDSTGNLWASYHSWVGSDSSKYRVMNINPIEWDHGMPYLVDTPSSPQGKIYTVKNVMSGLMLDNASGLSVNGNKVQQWTANGMTPQQWRFAPTGDGYYYLVNVACTTPPYMVLTDANASMDNGNTVYLYAYSGIPSQQWRTVRYVDGTVMIVNRLSGAALDMGLSMEPGAPAIQWQPSGSNTQRWFLQLVQ